MSLIDTNITFSKQTCDFAVGSLMGIGAVGIFILKISSYLLLGYIAFRITQIFIERFNSKRKIKQ